MLERERADEMGSKILPGSKTPQLTFRLSMVRVFDLPSLLRSFMAAAPSSLMPKWGQWCSAVDGSTPGWIRREEEARRRKQEAHSVQQRLGELDLYLGKGSVGILIDYDDEGRQNQEA